MQTVEEITVESRFKVTGSNQFSVQMVFSVNNWPFHDINFIFSATNYAITFGALWAPIDQVQCKEKSSASGPYYLFCHPGITKCSHLCLGLTTHAIFIVASENSLEISNLEANTSWKTLRSILFINRNSVY